MHELSLMENVRDLVLEQAALHEAGGVLAIHLRIGSLAGVEPEALRLAFEVVMDDTIARGAQLRIETVPALCHCAPCGRSFDADDGVCECPRCGAISRDLLQGRELELSSMELS